jgi:hypothetical protein
MQVKFFKKIALGLITVWFSLGGATLQAGIKKSVENIKHALGWDTINLKIMERDPAGHPTWEHESNAANHVDRKTSYQKNGNKDWQTVTVVSKTNKKTLYVDKKIWDEKGDLESVRVQDDVFHGDGRQMKGQITEQKYQDGRLIDELKKRYSPMTRDWGVTSKQAITYYADGDMKERLTEYPPSDEKKRESWSEIKEALGRKVTMASWDSATGNWK